MDLSKLREINSVQADKALSSQRHNSVLESNMAVANTVLSATTSLIKYLEGHTSKVAVINQLESIGTPDALEVIPHIDALHATLKTHKNTDLSELTTVMNSILNEAKQIPKELPEQKEIKLIDYADQFKELIKAVEAVQSVVKEQKLIAEAPIVNVPETNVTVEAPDLAPLQKGFKDVVGAVKNIVIPEYKTDTEAVQKLLKVANKLLKSILEKPIASGGGGGGRATPYGDDTGMPAFVTLIGGAVPVHEAVLTERYDYDDPTTIYLAEAVLGTSDGSLGWTITKYDLTDTNNASGKIAKDVSWTNRTAGSFN